MPICNACDEPYASEGDDSGVCADCHESIEARRAIDAMTEEEFVAFKAQCAADNDNRPRPARDLTRDGIIAALTVKRKPEPAHDGDAYGGVFLP